METPVLHREFLTVREAAARWRVAEKTVRRWVADGELVALQPAPGHALRIPAEAFEAQLFRDEAEAPLSAPSPKARESRRRGSSRGGGAMKNLNELLAEYDEKPQRRAGGYIISMETVAEARSRRLRDQAEFRGRASRSRTPRLDRMRHGLAIYTYMLEREEWEG